MTVSADELYDELHASRALPDVREAYRVYGRVLRLAVDQQTDFDALHLSSLYAKVDYLVRECHIGRDVSLRVHDTRVRLRNVLRLTDEELLLSRDADLLAITQLIAAAYQAPLPPYAQALSARDVPRRVAAHTVVAESMRLYVTRAEDAYVYGTCEELPDVEEVRVCYCYSGGTGCGDNAYLRPYLHRGVQLNLIRPQLYDGVFYPELIILDPDYLVDITAITHCMQDFGHDALLNLLAKFEPSEDTEATMLGNLAGQLLDDVVHDSSGNRPYAESFTAFCRDNALKVMMLDTQSLHNLHESGLTQKDNIARALHQGLAQRVGAFDASKVMLEPSFFCEMLGLQGRMDLLQLDGRILIEQKSGKGEWVKFARPDDPPRQKLQHYVQALLYQAMLHYSHGLSNQDVQLLLLYSKYSNGLIGVSPAPQLLHEAIRLRNQIAGNEDFFCRGHADVLLRLQPERLRTLSVNDNYWNTYKLPAIQAILDPIQQASPLEQAYFLRFVTFIANEQMLSKVGTRSKEGSGFASRWHDTLEEKYQTGNIYDQLELIDPSDDHQGSVTQLTFAYKPSRASEMSNFRIGDIVFAYQYEADQEPDARRTLVLRGSILAIGSDTLRMALRAPQSDWRVLRRGLSLHPVSKRYWAIEHDHMEALYRNLYVGMHALLQAPQERRDLLLLQRPPRVCSDVQLKGSYGAFDPLALHVKQAQDFFLIIGPPGTGKTSYGMLYTLQEQLLEEGSQVLITSFTNRAVDEICSKLDECGIDYLRFGSVNTCSPQHQSHVISERLKSLDTPEAMRRLVVQTRVIVGNTTTLSSSASLFRLKKFDLAIIDEASQILEPHLMALLSAKAPDGTPAIRKMVMIGDHKQLPAVVQQSQATSRVDDPQLNAIGLTDCRLSLFERLLTRYRHQPQVVYMLTRQGRMHRDIAEWPSRMFYGGKLQVVPLPHQTADCDEAHVRFIDVQSDDVLPGGKVNRAEAQVIAEQVWDIYQLTSASSVTAATSTATSATSVTTSTEPAFCPTSTVGVIVPYRNQIAAVRSAIEAVSQAHGVDAKAVGLLDITIDTVERFQGSQRDYILYGFTIQHPYQLTFLAGNTFEEDGMTIDRKLNVAMTRARKYLVMVGDSRVVSRNALFAQLIDDIGSKNGREE